MERRRSAVVAFILISLTLADVGLRDWGNVLGLVIIMAAMYLPHPAPTEEVTDDAVRQS